MGSFFAGIKAGTLGGIIYVSGTAFFLVAMMYVFRADANSSLLRSFNQICVSGQPINSTTTGSVGDCFDSIVQGLIPAGATVGFFVSLFYAGAFGVYFDYLPGKSALLKAEPLAVVCGLSLLVIGLGQLFSDFSFGVALYAFFAAWTVLFGVILGRLYTRYTRVVRFQSENPDLLRVIVDGRDFTGKSRTFATTSNHKLRARVSDDTSFKGWAASGGVTLEDPKSFETVMEVNGEGSVNGKVGKKH